MAEPHDIPISKNTIDHHAAGAKLVDNYITCSFIKDRHASHAEDRVAVPMVDQFVLDKHMPGKSSALQEEALHEAWSHLSKSEKQKLDKDELKYCDILEKRAKRILSDPDKADVTIPPVTEGPGMKALGRQLDKLVKDE